MADRADGNSPAVLSSSRVDVNLTGAVNNTREGKLWKQQNFVVGNIQSNYEDSTLEQSFAQNASQITVDPRHRERNGVDTVFSVARKGGELVRAPPRAHVHAEFLMKRPF